MERTNEAVVITEIILQVFRLNGQLLNAGDRLTKPMALTSARWQILGAVELAAHPLTVPQIARRKSLGRTPLPKGWMRRS